MLLNFIKNQFNGGFFLSLRNDRFYKTIAEDDLINRQRYRLFRTTTLVSVIITLITFLQALQIERSNNIAILMLGTMFPLLFVNYFVLPFHRKHRLAYAVIILDAFTTLHVLCYYSGGIRASAVMYMVGVMLLAFMLLGNKFGKAMFGLIAANIIYFWYLTENSNLISYELIGATSSMINMDYLVTFLFSMFILTAQMNYLESGKNIVIRRITEQRNELREMNIELRKLSIVASKADNAILITDSNGIAEWVNDGFVRLTGYAFNEITGKDHIDVLHGPMTDFSITSQLKDAIKNHQPFSGEILKYKKDGTRYWTQVTMTPITSDDSGQERFIFIESDITTRKIAEEKMKVYMQNLEKTNNELDKFAYVVSHDLKAPLRAIGNLTGWIEEDMGDKLPDEARNHFNTIKGRVVRMEGLINGILDYTKAARKEDLEEEFGTAELIQDTIELIGVPDKAVIHLKDNLPQLKTEKIKLQQVFLNLINNAIRYNDKDNPMVEIGSYDLGSHWEFYVKDNGPGIEARYHDKIFVIFQTLNARDEVESRGVGLAIVKKIIEESGGKIRVDSEKGKGAKFLFTWPKVRVRAIEDKLFQEYSEVA